jgi:hypothetical protein
MMPTPTEILQQALTAVTESAARYGVSEPEVAELRDRIHRQPGYAGGYLDGNLNALLVRIADDHHAECVRSDCRTCDNVREALLNRLADMTTIPARRRPRIVRWPGKN